MTANLDYQWVGAYKRRKPQRQEPFVRVHAELQEFRDARLMELLASDLDRALSGMRDGERV